MNIPFGKPIITEEEESRVLKVLKSGKLVHGPESEEFEKQFKDFTNSPYSVSVASCTAGMHLAYFNLGLSHEDEVIVPAQTHTATAHAVELTGARPVFVDSDPDTGNIDVNQIESSITNKTKAICVVHYLGIPVDMDAINKIAKKHKLFVVEDCALAIGSTINKKHVGLMGDIGSFSFYPVKHLTTGEGGMIITKNEKIANKIKIQRAFGVDRHHGARKQPGVYDVIELGFNYRMSEIEAAIGVAQLKKITGFLSQRRENYENLRELLQNCEEIKLIEHPSGKRQSSYYCAQIILRKKILKAKFDIIEHLSKNGIGTSIYYPKPVPHLKYYQEKYNFSESSFPVAAKFSYNSISLPIGPHLQPQHMNYIADKLKEKIKTIK